MYGGATCPPATSGVWQPCVLQCTLDNTSAVLFLNDTVVLDFAVPEGPKWRIINASDMASRQTAPEYMPPAFGAARTVYDSDTTALLTWGFWVETSTTNNSLPVYRLDLKSLQWSTIPAAPDSPTLPETVSIDDYPVMEFDTGHNRLVAYFPMQRQLLFFDLASGYWTAPPAAQSSAPDTVSYAASAFVVNEALGLRWLFLHGGINAVTLVSNIYILDLSTNLWQLPFDAQVSACF